MLHWLVLIECLLYLPNVQAIQYKLGPERLTRLGNSNVLRLPARVLIEMGDEGEGWSMRGGMRGGMEYERGDEGRGSGNM